MTADTRARHALMSVCTTGKVFFHSRGRAKKFSKMMASKHKTPFWVYRCAVCRGWHLTSKATRWKGWTQS